MGLMLVVTMPCPTEDCRESVKVFKDDALTTEFYSFVCPAGHAGPIRRDDESIPLPARRIEQQLRKKRESAQ